MTRNHIIIENLKGIAHLDFEIPNPGVYVITAANGSGKTTLMHCIERLSNKRVFRDNFTQHGSWNVDSFEESRITYRSNTEREVTYTYRDGSDSWRPTTQNSGALEDFDFSQIVAIPTLGMRVYIQNKTILGGKVRAAQSELRIAMARVLENDKFLDLLKMNLGDTRGRGGKNRRNNTAFLLPKRKDSRFGKPIQTYYSESSFSLGEIFALNLLFELEAIAENSLLVIDELEVALHPKVQVNILRYLEERAEEKNLTVIISTHSSSLIKCARKLIYLQNEGLGNINVLYDCYPAVALQEVCVEEDLQPDFVFLVEDSSAEIFLREKIRYYFSQVDHRVQPVSKILPVGGYAEVLRFLRRSDGYLLQRRIGKYAFLDHDVLNAREALRHKGGDRSPAENDLLDLFNSQNEKIRFLTITPELGLWNWILEHRNECQQLLNQRMPDAQINIRNLIDECARAIPNQAQNERVAAKNNIHWLLKQIERVSNRDVVRISQHFFASFVSAKYSIPANKNALMELFGPIFSRPGD